MCEMQGWRAAMEAGITLAQTSEGRQSVMMPSRSVIRSHLSLERARMQPALLRPCQNLWQSRLNWSGGSLMCATCTYLLQIVWKIHLQALFAVFDGHGGSQVSHIASKEFPKAGLRILSRPLRKTCLKELPNNTQS